MATFSTTFESGGVLADHGFVNYADFTLDNTAGLGGSTWGVRGSGSASARYYAEGYFHPGAAGLNIDSRCWDMSIDLDHADVAYSAFGYHLFSLRWATTGAPRDFLVLNHGLGAGGDGLELALSTPGFGSPVWSGAGLITPGVTQRVRLKVLLSSALDPDSFGGSTGLPDGEAWVYVDGTEVAHVTGLYAGIHVVPRVAEVSIAPMGRGDNFSISDECATTPGTFTNNPCCAHSANPGQGSPGGGSGTPSASGGSNLNLAPIQPTWVGMCEGGAMFLSAADPANSESWL